MNNLKLFLTTYFLKYSFDIFYLIQEILYKINF